MVADAAPFARVGGQRALVTRLISVVIPTYNPGLLVDRALVSVLTQHTNDKLEVVVVDDGSRDGTPARLRREYPMIRVLEQCNSGTASARNTGVAAAGGQFIALLDQDDVWDPDKLQRQMPLFVNPAVGMVHAGARFSNASGEVTSVEPGVDGLDFHALLTWCWLLQSTAVIRADVLREVGAFDETLTAADDWDLWLRLALHTQLAVVVDPLVSVLVHDGNQSNDAERMYRSAAALLIKHGRTHPGCGLCKSALSAADLTNRREFYRRVRDQAKQARREGKPIASLTLTGRALARHPRALGEFVRQRRS